ncbi:2-octaprenyl-6-methoxyphenyl hydroxylase [Methyloprofundus sedimenti]|uniref:2-octaprenyl-6-methoxyphenyl hydroxylase n=1 Tax=Methyloprofundus sedimenti TaxID=1420851 RepID=A0A1V8M501_9GAMM|nr:2-octaprenyl-6-methoxyphenyl hydroxylase [Methyloprofundus sedimenti]OQK16635.1 2-octaprenyl-6-methoxyphenyl hydroxylase [Methyloprofundus sedimenti]
MKQDYDVFIVGGGLAGNCLALALQNSPLKIAIAEANTPEQLHNSPAGDRALALASGSVKMLESLGIWSHAKALATPIKTIHVSDQGHFGKTRLSAEKEGVAALGYVITARDLETVVAQLVEQAGIEQICPARVIGIASDEQHAHVSLKQLDASLSISARLVVGADGGQSTVRNLLEIDQAVTEYQQTAIVTTIKTELAHNNIAYERFTSSGPLALLPFKQDYAVVWTRTTEEAEQLIMDSDDEFLASLQACFGYKLGQFSLTAPRRSFPLSLIRAKSLHSGRVVIIGNAVHQLHPVAGQGFNLGLRDVVQLAEMLLNEAQKGGDIGAPSLLEQYAQQRQKDHDTVANFTDSVVKLFSNQWLSLAVARNSGLALLDIIPGAKKQLARYAMGLNARMPHIGIRRRV